MRPALVKTLSLHATLMTCIQSASAQLLQDISPSVVNETVIASVLSARRAQTVEDIDRVVRQLRAAVVSVPATDLRAGGYRLPPAGHVLSDGRSDHPLAATHGFYRLPGALRTATDRSGMLLAYCPFDIRGETPSTGRLAGRRSPTDTLVEDAVAMAVVAAGANGRFDTTCSDLRNLSPREIRRASQRATNGIDDDIVVLLTHQQLNTVPSPSMHFAATVDSHADLLALSETRIGLAGVSDRQVRLVRALNQFFVARVEESPTGQRTVTWTPLTATARWSNSGLTDDRQNQADQALISGAIGMGHAGHPARPDISGSTDATGLTSALTLGSRRLQSNGTVFDHGVLQTGIAFMDSTVDTSSPGNLRAWAGLSGTAQQAFVIRHSAGNSGTAGVPAYRDRLRIEGDGRLWLGDIPAATLAATALPTFPGPVTHTTLAGNTGIFTDAATTTTSNGYLLLGQRNESSYDLKQAAGLRFFSSSNGSGMELRLLDFISSLPVTSNGNILLNTTGRTGIAHAPGSALTHTLDVNGTTRIRGSLQVDAGSTPSVVLLADGANAARLQLQTVDASRRLTLGLPASGDIHAWLRLGTALQPDRDLLSFAVDGSGVTTTTLSSRVQANRRLTIGPDSGETGPILLVNGASSITGNTELVGNLTVPDNFVTSLQSLLAGQSGFSGPVTAQDGLTVTAQGNATANAGMRVTGALVNANAGLSTTSATFSALVTAGAGLRVDNAAVRAEAGMSVNNASLIANGGLDIGRHATFNNNLAVDGDVTIDGTLTLKGRVNGLNDLTLNFMGYTDVNKTLSQARPVGSVTVDVNTQTARVFLNEANPWLHAIDQALATTSTPDFVGMKIGNGGVTSLGAIRTGDGGYLLGNLEGQASSASKLLKTMKIRLIKNGLAYGTVDLNRGDETGDSLITLPVSAVYNYSNGLINPTFNPDGNNDDRSASLTLTTLNTTVNVTCKRVSFQNQQVGNCALPDASLLAFTLSTNNQSVFKANTYNLGTGLTIGKLTTNKTTFTTTVNPQSAIANVTPAASKLAISSPFASATNVTLTPGTSNNTLSINLASNFSTHATTMNQDLKTTSEATFTGVRVGEGGAGFSGSLTSNNLSAVVSLKANNIQLLNDTTSVMELIGSTASATFGSAAAGRVAVSTSEDSTTVTATRFAGTARFARTIDATIGFDFQSPTGSPISATVTRSTSNPTQFTVNTTLADGALPGTVFVDGSIPGSKLAAGSITGAKVKNFQIRGEHLASDFTVTAAMWQPGSIGPNALGSGIVDTTKIVNGEVDTRHLVDGAVTSEKIPDGSISMGKLDASLQDTLNGSSDIRLKSRITPVDPPALLQRISGVRTHTYRFVYDSGSTPQIGVIAQELQTLFPELVVEQQQGPFAGFLSVDYNALGAMAAAAAGELARTLQRWGLATPDPDTLAIQKARLTATRLQAEKMTAEAVTARSVRSDRLEAEKLTTTSLDTARGRSRQLTAERIYSGNGEGLAGPGGLPVMQQLADGQYLLQVSGADGSHAAATITVAGGVVRVVPMMPGALGIQANGGLVLVTGQGQWIRASWLRTG